MKSKVQFFPILADEAQDVNNKEQLALVLRYGDRNGEIKENFITFIHCNKGGSGIEIADLVKKEIRQLGLDLLHCRRQGYDGAGNMAGKWCICIDKVRVSKSFICSLCLSLS